ncbi:hypothetical protein [Haloimpatiens lingqiaonensis]|uniref:hypothetical protein n=1 Tax=Haloimpatiens lingqiaonensis TaxID=1380675 RepID=UPI0010FEE72D|nr:hypothetical protein [Haloimpatiens lingqiaonensis]
MKMQLCSKTKAGKWAAILTVLFILLISLKMSSLARFIRLPLPTPVIAVIGVVGFIVGVVSIIKNKDIALLTLLSIPVGLLIIFWTIAEIAFTH